MKNIDNILTKEDKELVISDLIIFYTEQKKTLLDSMEEIQSYNKPEKVSMTLDTITDYENKIETLNSILQTL